MNDPSMRAYSLYRAVIDLHRLLQLCFDEDREVCSSQAFDDIANALLGVKGNHGMSNLNSLAHQVRSLEKALIGFKYDV